MKTYKDFSNQYIGCSDIAALVMVGCGKGGVCAEMLRFGEDGGYDAYVVTDADVVIPEHYSKVASFSYWVKIYDDEGLKFKAEGKEINVYRAGQYGCIIQVIP